MRRLAHWVLVAVVTVSGAGVRSVEAARQSAEAAPPGWIPGIHQQIAAAEYEVSWQDSPGVEGVEASWQAPNRAHGFRTWFTKDGVIVVPRTDEEPSWTWGLAVSGYGRGSTAWPVPAATLSPAGQRIDYLRGALDEWYENSAEGLKQGFVLPAPPEEQASVSSTEPWTGKTREPIYLELTLSGELAPSFSTDGQAIDFLTTSGARALRYTELVVTDAAGKVLPAWMEGRAGEGTRLIRIVLDDQEALYPITIDPLLTSPAWTAESNQIAAQLGWSVATAGDVNADGYSDVIVGAPMYDNGQTDEGRAFVYLGSASGLALGAAWTAESDQASARFGTSVATAGDVNGDGFSDVIVGANLFDNGQTDEGRAFVYLGSASGLASIPAWTSESDQASAQFGFSVATAGDVNGDLRSDVIVGAPNHDNTETNEGKAFIYLGTVSGPAATPIWTAESGQANALFATSVATAGDVNADGFADVIIGAYNYDNSETDEGRAYVYLGSVSGPGPSAGWTAESNQASAFFGIAVSTAGDVNGDGYSDVIVGANGFDNDQLDEGRVFVFFGSDSGPGASPGWTAESNAALPSFGGSVSTAGDVNGDGFSDVIVGALLLDNGTGGEGLAFVYLGSASAMSPSPSWTADSNQVNAHFGRSVSTAGDVNGDGYSDVVVGAARFNNGQGTEGRAFAYLGGASGPGATAAWTCDGNRILSQTGSSVALGDVNGDGFSDVIAGAPAYSNGQTEEGRMVVHLGTASGPGASPDWTVESDTANARFGYAVASAGDVNGDGYDDVIMGAPYFANGQPQEGGAFLYLGSASGLAGSPQWRAESNLVNAGLGWSVAGAGDINGDGFSDVIVGTISYDNGETNEGQVQVYLGSSAGLAPNPAWIAESNRPGALFGGSVASAGDVNADGYADIIVGADGYANGQILEGQASIFLGSPAGPGTSPAWSAESNQSNSRFGFTVASAGDVNGDGYSDIIVGAPAEGRAFLYTGGAAGPGLAPAWIADSGQAGAEFGHSVSAAGDVNGDGYADVIVGARRFDNGAIDSGRALVYLGSASGLSLSPAWAAECSQLDAECGTAVGGAGDVNGDSFSDVIVGAPHHRIGVNQYGRVLVHAGNGPGGVSLPLRQLRPGDATPISLLGASDSADSFRLSLSGRTPYGRGLVRLEWEARPVGMPFTGSATGIGAWTDTGSTGAALSGLAQSLPPDTAWHWRLRTQYHPSTSPFQRAGRWITLPHNGPLETDLRTSMNSDVSVAPTCQPEPALAGEEVSCAIDVVNNGPDAAVVTVTDYLPQGAALISVTSTQGSCSAGAGTSTCLLGPLQAGGSARITVVIRMSVPGSFTSLVAASIGGADLAPADNAANVVTTVSAPGLGNRVWLDSNGNGIQDSGEPGVPDALVVLARATGVLLDATWTDSAGSYTFSGLSASESYVVRIIPPPGYALTAADQGDDRLDSDVDPFFQTTPVISITTGLDAIRWDAGIIPVCLAPDEPIFIAATTLSTDGNQYPILHFQDGNQPVQVTGYNVYRSSVAGAPPASWPMVASDVIDMDEAVPNRQWVDTSGSVSPTGIWYYRVRAWNDRCSAEGP